MMIYGIFNFFLCLLGGVLGDFYLIFFDGLFFIFNGYGEFVLLKVINVEV